VEALTDKIASLLSNDDLRADFGKKAQEHAMARWDYNVMNEQLKELYRSSVS
jgi:glycosyltransferase involved in cell wall biosynthesis